MTSGQAISVALGVLFGLWAWWWHRTQRCPSCAAVEPNRGAMRRHLRERHVAE